MRKKSAGLKTSCYIRQRTCESGDDLDDLGEPEDRMLDGMHINVLHAASCPVQIAL
jgi:hypothetical protein